MNTPDQTPSLEAAPGVDESVPMWLHIAAAAAAFGFWRPPVSGDIVKGVDHWIIMFPVSLLGAAILASVFYGVSRLNENKKARYSRAFVMALWIVVGVTVLRSWA